MRIMSFSSCLPWKSDFHVFTGVVALGSKLCHQRGQHETILT